MAALSFWILYILVNDFSVTPGQFLSQVLGVAAILVKWPGLFVQNFLPPLYKRSLNMKFELKWPSGFREDV